MHQLPLQPLYPNDQAVLHLLCFPYAAGSASSYRFLTRILPPSALERLAVWAIEYPGHGNQRGRETPCAEFSALVEAVTVAALPLFDGETEVALLGCSLGGIISFEVARGIRDRTGANLRHLYVAACGAPQFPFTSPDASSVETLTASLRCFGTSPDEREIVRGWPWYQAVYSLPRTYRYSEDRPLDCPISAFGGLRDASVEREALLGWQEQTTGPFTCHLLDAPHLFVRYPDFVVPLVKEVIQDLDLPVRQTSRQEGDTYAYAQ